jgi:capsule polysaccharide modification protein KpsS
MPIAKQNDVLTLDGRRFYVQDVENPAGITKGPGCFTIYQAEERKEYDYGY